MPSGTAVCNFSMAVNLCRPREVEWVKAPFMLCLS